MPNSTNTHANSVTNTIASSVNSDLQETLHDTLHENLQDTLFDKPFTTPLDKASRFSFDEQVVACFPDMIRRSVPGYGQVLSMLPIIARRHCQYRQLNEHGQKVSRIYDLGCSLGGATMALLNEQANGFAENEVQIKAIDISPAMTEKATHLIAKHYPKHDIEVITADICKVAIQPCDMIVINLTLQFLPVEQRLALLKKCHNALVQGGVLILTEKTHLNNEQDDAWRVERYYDFKRANGYSELEISGKRTALENVLITDTLEAHHQRLAMAGFERSMTWFQFLNFYSLVAFK